MHAIKGGWVGQTFALAKCNESGGRKSRIRRSKEERKEMVESFIKKYQSLNSGNFPSLNLTHKEVGGSFYTVREIVREIIQENRVLGPGKSLLGLQNADQLLEQHPLGTISTGPRIPDSISPNGTAVVSDHGQHIIEESETISIGTCTEPQLLGFESEQMINGSLVTTENEESDKPKVEVIQLNELLETEETGREVPSSRAKVIQVEDVVAPQQLGFDSGGRVTKENEKSDEPKVEVIQLNDVSETEETSKEVEASSAKVTQLEDVIVETFPLRPFPESAEKSDESSTEVKPFDETFKETDMERVQLESGKNIYHIDEITGSTSSSLVAYEEVEAMVSPILEGNSGLGTEKALRDPVLESSSSSSTRQGIANDTHEILVEAILYQPDEAVAETNDLKAQIVGQAKSSDGASTRTSSGKLVTHEVDRESKADVQHRYNLPKGNNPQLDRINLGSWDGASKSPVEAETNPFWAIFKGFVTAFVKFWSE
ncbi:hypothetical protein K2173_020624 [Erythroxylum novogranatense]|uniref:AT3G52170-like helix-turn-helix domain-containing protein n=1 Tax=Erythroxylum novogranatense TaxID=1862640 RepID=A0AAV8TH85_9ROSI|nr:hypothetical protein K2173_020624 [Erythroxylum novogranatense]